jgi:iron(III) transport system substrate-binding protein
MHTVHSRRINGGWEAIVRVRALRVWLIASLCLLLAAGYLLVAPPSQGAGVETAPWAALVSLAQQEGTVRISGPRGLPAFKKAITDGFAATYHITVDYSQLEPEDVRARVRAVGANGDAPWDVFVGGNDTLMFKLKAMGVLAPIEPALILPDVKDPSKWTDGRLPFIDADHLGVAFLKQPAQFFYVNTTRANLDDIKSYRDLLAPRWRGQILVGRDPRDPSSARLVFAFFLSAPGLGPDFVRELVTKQKLIIPKNLKEAAQLLSAAQFMMCICNNAQGTELVGRGLPYAKLDPHRVREGTIVTSSFANLALARRAPHPNAAKLYANWLLTSAAGLAVSRATKLPSVRVDVPKDFIPAQALIDPRWPDWSDESALKLAEEASQFAVELLGPKKP